MERNTIRIGILIGYITVFSIAITFFVTRAYYQAEIRAIQEQHLARMAAVKEKQQVQLTRIWDKAIAQARAEQERLEVREYHRGKYEACVMEYVAFGRSLNCKQMVIVGFRDKVHDRAGLKSWEKLWLEILNLKHG